MLVGASLLLPLILSYGLNVRSNLPEMSRLVVVAFFSTIFGAVSLLVLFAPRFASVARIACLRIWVCGFVLMLGLAILLSFFLATYLSAIMAKEGP